MKIGVLSDTHVPDVFPALPPRVLDALSGIDIILHVGDVCELSVLQQLEPIAQTFAVAGEQDSPEVKRYLEETQRLEFENRAVGLVHGHRAWQTGWMAGMLNRFSRTRREKTLHDFLLSEFSNVDVVVFGHTHEPYIKMHGSVLLFNPGAVAPKPGQIGTMGILEINDRAIKARIISL